ncbi:hypothetical protein BUALT_Bualt17G0028200 [Buddleja alternifolia]|uniref:Uncharacterized protein n=1 Tax=Buddleja alternifolia TaxID=168488 RepID=A0AAV6WC00_9LAMI|nr:hypothetical protein BUALT_Bualt17G0028200 [Buddleja alternifolia]
MADNHDASAGIDERPSVDQVAKAVEDVGKDDMFVDCPDEIETSESQQTPDDKDNLKDDECNESESAIKVQHLMAEIELLRDMHERNVAEKERFAREYEEERTEFMRERSENEAEVKELQSVLHRKDQEIGFLNAKVAELSESASTFYSNSISEHENMSKLYEAQIEHVQHVDGIVNRVLASLSTTLHQEELADGSLIEKISTIEKSVTFLIEKYNLFRSESDQLRRCLTEVGTDCGMMDDIGIFVVARDVILELMGKQANLYQNLSILENENRKFVEQIEKQRSILENANAQIGKLSAEVEQEKNRYLNTKEKLSMAVTKGKALVQQRDSLKQLLAEKTSELEKCSIQLQEKSSALEVAEQTKESLAEKDTILQKCGKILSEGVAEEELQPIELQTTEIPEKLRWLADENKSLKNISLQFSKVTDALLLFDFPETVVSSELDHRVRWLADSFYMCKEEAMKLQSAIAQTKEAANGEIEHLSTSLLAETQEKSYLQAELEDLRNKYEEHERVHHEVVEAMEALNKDIGHLTKSLLEESEEKNYLQSEVENLRQKYEGAVQKEHLASLEKDKIVNMLLEASGLANDGQKEDHPENPETSTIVDNCLVKIKEKTRGLESCQVDVEIFESFKSLLYIRDQEMSQYKLIVEEDILDRVEMKRLSDELEKVNQELDALNQEKAVTQKNLEQLEDRCGLLKDKLSMAVKKGKGLVQERENLKSALNEKNTEIDKLKSEMQQTLSTYNECQDQITKLSLDVQRISQLETDVIATKEHADQLEQFLAESNSMLQRLIESIERITTPADLAFDDPLEKVKWLAGYLTEHEIARTEVEQELREVKDETSSLASKLSEVQKVKKSLEDALSIAENNISGLLDEKKELELSKTLLEKELEKEKAESSSHTNKFEEVSMSKRALEDALALAESNISKLMNERDIAEESRALAEDQLQKLKEEFSNHISQLADAEKTIQSLKDTLSIAENNIYQLLDEKKELEVTKAFLEKELQKIKDEASSHTNKFEDVSVSKRALEDALALAENNISKFMNERDMAVESRDLAEDELQKLKEESSNNISKLAEAEKTIQSLEDALSQAQKNVSLLAEENSNVQIGRADLESEITKLREEADLHASKISDASFTIKSLEDALVNAESKISNLVEEKQKAEEEILALSSKLEHCMEELAGTRGSVENRSLEISGQLSRLQPHLEDERLSSLIGQCFERKFESLNNMDYVLKEMGDCFLEMDSDVLQNIPIEDDSSISTTLPSIPEFAWDMEMLNNEANGVDNESIMFHIEKMNERFHLKGKILADKFDNVSTLMDESMAALLRRLHITNDRVISVIRYTKSLQQQVKDMETDKQRREDTIASLESDIKILSSACADATHRLELNVHENMSALRSIQELVKLDGIISMDHEAVGGDVMMSEKLLFATRKNQDVSKMFQDVISKFSSITEDMQKKYEESQLTFDEVLEERDQYKDKISKLDTDLEAQRHLCDEMRLKLDDYEEKKDKWANREAELSTSLSKIHGTSFIIGRLPLISISSKIHLDKVNDVEVPDIRDSHDSADVRKLFYVIDSFNGLLHKVTSLSHEKEELQSTIDEQILEIEFLKKQVENQLYNERVSEKMKTLLKLESGLHDIVRKMGGSDLMDGHKDDGAIWLLPLLDKLVMATMMESESLKSKNEELVAKLHGTQSVVDDLSNKVKLLEDSNQARTVPAEIDQEREISVASQTEITEIQDVFAACPGWCMIFTTLKCAGKHLVRVQYPSVPSAAHVRTLRKGSSDHLAINIDSDSERLINHKESDEDKGHLFKSLNTTGLIPRQGRTVQTELMVFGYRVVEL